MRGKRQGGDVLTISAVAGTTPKKYPLAPVAQNISYETVSDQPEAQPNQPLEMPLSFHGGLANSKYDVQSASCIINTGMGVHEPNIIRAPIKPTTVTLTGAANPPMYYFEADVNDSGADDGRPRLYIIACEAAEINVYKLSLAHGYTATGTGVTTDTTAKTLTDARATWTVSEWVGEIVTCNSQTLTVTSNTATILTGTGDWSADPTDGQAYKIGVGDFGTLLSTQTFALTPTQPMGRPAKWYDGTNTQWRLPTGDTTNDIQSLTAIASGAAADTWEPTDSGACDADARFLCVVGNKLYRTTGANEVSILARNTSPSTEANWGGEFYAGSDATNITAIGEAGGLAYMTKEGEDGGLLEWDGEGDADNVLPEIGSGARNGQGMCYWHGGWMIPANGLWWTRTGRPIGPDSNPNNRANHPYTATGSSKYIKHGLWHGTAGYGPHLYALYLDSYGSTMTLLWGREREDTDPRGWGPLIWHGVASLFGDRDDFHGIFIAETSEYTLDDGTTDIRPTLWAAHGNNVAWFQLDRDGAPVSRRGDINIYDSATRVDSGDIDWDMPNVNKQLRVVDGTAENMASGDLFRIYASLDGVTSAPVGANITEDGFWERFWVQDTSDTARSAVAGVIWTRTGGVRDGTNGPLIKNVMLRAVALPDTTNVWTFLVCAEEETMRTAKLIRTQMEGYKNDLKKFELPDGDSFNGVLTGIRMLRANEVRELAVDRDAKGSALPLPRYIMAATVREMVSA